jgi:pimeloyl-ACP methyl ester carboxylesterase
VLAGHSAGGIYVLNFARHYPDEVAGVVLLDSMHPEQYSRISGWPTFYEAFRRYTGILPPLTRLGFGRILYASAYAGLPARARDEERAFLATPRSSRSVRDEFSKLRTAMKQAGTLRTLGDKPLMVLTARKDAQGGWAGAQNDLARLSTNSAHRVFDDATHSMMTEDKATAAKSSQGIRDVVDAARTGQPLTAN